MYSMIIYHTFVSSVYIFIGKSDKPHEILIGWIFVTITEICFPILRIFLGFFAV